ncbi:ferredoxin [Streptomyces sp. NBC_01803]|uniref:ferredoxin n=1 Tax=Streptomyces sp. NBC_01803 TaxID=2975946 RepID=UPI002DD9EFB9|nr:ferredoxin [Streptomyces sp. NBC_01803]WSA45694.1 ferredoxin [Streptomyces sp. NBC_01803]
MRIEVDTSRCCGAGMCALTVPQVFDQSEDEGTVVLLDPRPPTGLHGAVRQAAQLCPCQTITVTERRA